MSEEVNVPKVGPVNKKILIPVVVGAAAFIGWRYYVARNSTGTGDDATATDDGSGDFGDGSAIPDVLNSVPADGSYGIADGTTDTTQSTVPTTNAGWTQAATTQLTQSDSWSYTDIVTALGNYLNNRSLTTLQQSIVQAAIAVEGYPPEGSHTIVSGGDTGITIAPTDVKVTTTATEATVTFTGVSGASYYRVYRSGAATNVGSGAGSPVVVSGLTPNTSYSFTVRAMSSAGLRGPASPSVKAKTAAVTLKAPNKPRITAIAATSAHFATSAVPGATGYNWYVNGVAHGHSDAPSYTASGLHSKTSYRVTVAADTATQAPSKQSTTATFKTK